MHSYLNGFEINDIGHYGIGHGCVLARPKIVDPPEECWPDMKIMNELGKRVSPPELWYDDHEQFLGDTIMAIAAEKAGIVKRGVPCIVGPQPDEALEVIENIAARVGAPGGCPCGGGRWAP